MYCCSRVVVRLRLLRPAMHTAAWNTAVHHLHRLPQVADDTGLGFKLLGDTIAQYASLSSAEQPTTDVEKINQWVK